MMDSASRRLYRRLLRAVRASVKFHRPAAANLRRALRDDFEAAYSQATSEPVANVKFVESARNTIALLMSSAISPRKHPLDTSHMAATKVRLQDEKYDISRPLDWNPAPAKGVAEAEPELSHTLANDIIKNLASLTYHHLSPHTQMADSSKSSGTPKIQKLTSGRVSKSKPVADRVPSVSSDSIALDALGGIADARTLSSGQRSPFSGEYLIPSLRVSPKPGRGPVYSRMQRWDGQNPSAVLALGQKQTAGQTDASSTKAIETLTSLQVRLAALKEKYTLARRKEDEERGAAAAAAVRAGTTAGSAQGKSPPLPSDQLFRQMREMRGVIKSTQNRLEAAQRARAVTSLPQVWLSELIDNIEASEGVWVGGTRMNKWAKRQWLAP